MKETLLIGVLAAAQVTLQVIALIVLARLPRERVVAGRKWLWALVIVFLSLAGAITFLAAGRRPAPVDEIPAHELSSDRVKRTVQSLYGEEPR